MKINLLEPKVFNRISAGEVVERPASIVKELVENSIDAGATTISISIENGGITKIEVSDNGSGIEKDDLPLAFMPHATSKIKTVDDLDAIMSLGFRGEALASIASVCHVTLTSKTKDSENGYCIKVDGGEQSSITEIARVTGTTITACDLFYNTPVRAKFLRRSKSEESEVTHLIEKFMLAHPEIAFSYYVDGNKVFNTNSCSMSDIIYTIYGKEVYNSLIPVNYSEDEITLTGYITKPTLSKSNRSYQTLFVNGRYVENYLVSQAVQGVYESFLMKGRFPVYVLSLVVPANRIDVNVHPSKREVKFDNTGLIFGLVRKAIEKALLSVDQIANFVSQENEDEAIEGKELSSPYNEFGFNPVINRNSDKLSPAEGSSFSKVDNFESDDIIIRESDVFVPKQEESQSDKTSLPDFKNFKLPEKDISENKLGGPFYFSQSKNNTLSSLKSEETSKGFLSADVKSEMKILGTVFKTYMVIELEDCIYFVDQHAAHERLLYDKLLKSVNDKKVVKQDLLAPYDFTVGPREEQSIEECLESLKNIGFDIAKIGGRSWRISSLPLVLADINLEGFVDELVKEGINLEHKPSEFIHDKLCQSACKHAIKAGDSITNDECGYIIEQVRKGVMLCPHGRPIVLCITRHEFEKLFKRII